MAAIGDTYRLESPGEGVGPVITGAVPSTGTLVNVGT